jgi:CubicO group peptidase (beta-lactamase class C family)
LRYLSRGLALVAALVGCTPESPPRGPTPAPQERDRAARVVGALVPVVHIQGTPARRAGLADRMQHFHVPGVSVAVVEGGTIAWARGFGVAERGKSAAITPKTLFQAGSLSKPVTATATLLLAEQGKLSLDEDVNDYLQAWKVPENEFTATEKVTLRRLVSHTAGVNLHGFPGYESTATLPTIVQILEGESPASTSPIRVTAVPGSTLRYSGGGITIEQLVLTEVTGKPFPALMKELVLAPAGMRDSTFDQPLPPAAAARASSAHDISGAPIAGRFHLYPEMAAAGLWSTPSDLLGWAIAIADAYAGRPSPLLTRASARAMLTPVQGPVALGPFVRGEGRALRFGHPGTDEGFHAEIVYFPELRQGAAVMVNGYAGRPLLREILFAIADEYDWLDFGPDTLHPVAVDARTRETIVGRYAGKFERIPVEAHIRSAGDELHFDSERLGLSSPLVFVSKTSFVVEDSGDELSITLTADGAVEALQYGDIALARQAGAPPP